MNKKKLSIIIVAILMMLSIIASQIGSASASCLRNCPSGGYGNSAPTEEAATS